MPPKFQSSFIPKGPVTVSNAGPSFGQKTRERGLFSFLAFVIFVISALLAVGVFGYKFYLKYSINKMGADLENARKTLEPEVINELTRFNNRLISTRDLIAKHYIFSSLFKFLEVSTPKTVRFKNFNYSMTENGFELSMNGEARGYAALALQADIFNKSQYFKNPIFSDLILNERGDVGFSFKAIVDPSLVSYRGELKSASVPTVSTTTASSTPN